MEVYADEICRGIESGLFRFVAHPDLALQGYPHGWDVECERIMRKISANVKNMPFLWRLMPMHFRIKEHIPVKMRSVFRKNTVLNI